MNWQTMIDPAFSSRLCLTLLHSIWQVALLVLLAAAVDRLWRRRSVERSYAIYVAVLLAAFIAVPITFAFVEKDVSGSFSIYSQLGTGDMTNTAQIEQDFSSEQLNANIAAEIAPEPSAVRGSIPPPAADRPPSPPESRSTLSPYIDWHRFAPWLAVVYCAGVVMMLVRLSYAIIRANRLGSQAKPIVTGHVFETMQAFANKWSMQVVPAIANARQIVVPQVIGLLRPTILLPTSAITGLSPDELEMILAHELAHVRRHDMWVNLIQRMAEAVLFFNPALWYLSRRISTLREYCCDELACESVAAPTAETRQRYAQALVRVVELKQDSVRTIQVTALAATGRSPSELRRRVARLFGEPVCEPFRFSRSGWLVLAVATLLLIAGPAVWESHAKSAGDNVLLAEDDDQQDPDSTEDKSVGNDDGTEKKPGNSNGGPGVDEDAEKNIQWGEAVEGLRLGIRPSDLAKHPTKFRRGDWLKYEVWIRNDTDQAIHAPFDSRKVPSPAVRTDGKSIDLLGLSIRNHYAAGIPIVTLAPGESTPWPPWSTQHPLQIQVGAKEGPNAGWPLALPVGKYPCLAEMNFRYQLGGTTFGDQAGNIKSIDLRTASAEIEILPAARLQMHWAYLYAPADSAIPELARDPNRRLLDWADSDGKMSKVLISSLSEVVFDEGDLLAVTTQSDAGNPSRFAVDLQLTSAADVRMKRQTTALLQGDMNPRLHLAILIDGKVLTAVRIDDHLNGQIVISDNFTKAEAEELASAIKPALGRDEGRVIWGPSRDGLVAGAKLLSATDTLSPGDPVVVQFVLKNESEKEQTVVLRQFGDSHPVLGGNNRINLNVTGSSREHYQHVLKPGEILEARQYRVSFDSKGLPVGKYHVTTSSAFVIHTAPNRGTGVRYGKSIPFVIGDGLAKKLSPSLPNNDQAKKIYWGRPVSGLVVGARMVNGKSDWKDGEDMVAELMLRNGTDQEITFAYQIPPSASDWNLHLETEGRKHVRLDSIWFTGRNPKLRRTISLKPGEQIPITGIDAKVLKDDLPIDMAIEGPRIRLLQKHVKFEYGDPQRLIAGKGKYFFNVAVTVYRTDIPDLTMVVSAGAVPVVVNELP